MRYSGRMTKSEYELATWKEFFADALARGIAGPSDYAEREMVKHVAEMAKMSPPPWR
jgi:hypothetical protein